MQGVNAHLPSGAMPVVRRRERSASLTSGPWRATLCARAPCTPSTSTASSLHAASSFFVASASNSSTTRLHAGRSRSSTSWSTALSPRSAIRSRPSVTPTRFASSGPSLAMTLSNSSPFVSAPANARSASAPTFSRSSLPTFSASSPSELRRQAGHVADRLGEGAEERLAELVLQLDHALDAVLRHERLHAVLADLAERLVAEAAHQLVDRLLAEIRGQLPEHLLDGGAAREERRRLLHGLGAERSCAGPRGSDRPPRSSRPRGGSRPAPRWRTSCHFIRARTSAPSLPAMRSAASAPLTTGVAACAARLRSRPARTRLTQAMMYAKRA